MSKHLNLAIVAIDDAVENPGKYPDPIALAIFKNDLRKTVSCAYDGLLNLREIDEAIRHAATHIPTARIQAIVKKWGGK